MSLAYEAGSATRIGPHLVPDGKAVIRLLVDHNPRRAGSKTYDRFTRYVDGMTYDDAIKSGIKRNDIVWDLERHYVEIDGSLPSRRQTQRVVSDTFDLSQRSPGEELWLWRYRQLSPTGRR